jgi:cytochrome P450
MTEVLRNSKVFSSTGYANLMGLVFGHSILEMAHPEHTAHRSLVSQAFRPLL